MAIQITHNGGGMASKGLRVISCQVTQDIEVGYNLSHTTETLIGYTGWRYETLGISELCLYPPTPNLDARQND